MIFPDNSIEIAHDEVGNPEKGSFAWTIKLNRNLADGYSLDQKERDSQTINPDLKLMGTNLNCSYQDGNTYVKGRGGTLRIEIPYEAIDGLIEALKKAKEKNSDVVKDVYEDFDKWHGKK